MGKIALIISREFTQRVRKKSFIITTLLAPLLMAAMVALPALINIYGSDSKQREVVVVEQMGSGVGTKLLNADNLTFTPIEGSYPEVTKTHPSAFAYLVIGGDIIDNPSSVQLYTNGQSTAKIEGEIRNQLSSIITEQRILRTGIKGLDSLISAVKARAVIQTFQIGVNESGQLDQKASSVGASMGIAYVASFIIYMFILMYGMMVLQGVVEEKSSRIIEVIVSSVKPFELMMGKILGVAMVALLQFLIWVVVCGAALIALPSFTGDPSTVAMIGGMSSGMAGAISTILDPMFMMRIVLSFVVFFLGGYLLYASMFAAIGSAVDNVADVQQLQVPITMPLIISILVMLSVMQDPNSTAAFWFSIIPLTSPIIMMARVAYGVPWWEFVLSVVLLYGSFVAITYVAAKIYRVGIFMYGKKPTFGEILRWARYKG